MTGKQHIIEHFWNGREGIIPWGCIYDEERKIVYPITVSSVITRNFTSPLSLLQVEDLGDNVILLLGDQTGLGKLYDANGNTWPSDQKLVKRFVVIRNQLNRDPLLLILAKENEHLRLFGGKITNKNNPFTNIVSLDTINARHEFFDIARFRNRILFLLLKPDRKLDLRVVLYWSKQNISFDNLDLLSFFALGENSDDSQDFLVMTFEEYYIALPSSSFHFIWENFMVCNDGVYLLRATEIAGTFSLIYEKILDLAIPDEFGGGDIYNILAGFQIFREGVAISIRGKTYVVYANGKTEVINQATVPSMIIPHAPLMIHRLGIAHTVSPFLAGPMTSRIALTDNFLIISDRQNTTTLHIAKRINTGKIIKGKAFFITDFGSEKIKYLKRISPLRYSEFYIQTEDPPFELPPFQSEPPFLGGDPSASAEEIIENDWVTVRGAGKMFVFEFEVPQSFQAVFTVEYDEGK